MIPHAHYKVRPIHQPGESLAGYVYRFHSANGHRVPVGVHKLVMALYDRRTVYKQVPYGDREETFDRVQQLLGVNCVLEAAWWIDGDYPSRLFNDAGDALRFCPHCIDAFGIHLAIWELPLVVACPIHGNYLISACPQCERELRWNHLAPDWACACGLDIRSTTTSKASPALIQRSTMLAGTTDVQRPEAYPQGALCVHAIPRQRLECAYRNLYRAHALRNAIVAALRRRQPKTSQDSSARTVRWEPRRWEMKLLQSWPSSFHEALLRLVRRYWHSNTSTFVLATKGSIVEDVVAHLGPSLTEDWVSDMMRRAAQQLIDDFKAPIAARTLVFFNPRYGVRERDNRLACFWNWWRMTQRSLLKCGGESLAPCRLGQPVREDLREVMSVTLLSRLVDAANAGADPHCYASMFGTWWYEAEGPHPVTLLRGLSDALIALPYSRLAELTLRLDVLERT